MRYLSKSQFQRGLQCGKSLWLYREQPELQDPVSPEQQAIFDAGTEVGVLARKWLGGGSLIEADHLHPDEALAQTQAALAGGARILYEAAFLYDDVLVRADLMRKNGDGTWDLYEVKSTTKLEDSHYTDVAIQRHVIEGAGYQLAHARLVHLDSSYVRYGALDLTKLFKAMDVTAATNGLLDLIPTQLARMKAEIAAPAAPVRDIGPHCTKPQDCSFQGHCWAHVPAYSVFNLAGARKDKTTKLWQAGHKTVADIPDGEKLTEYQQAQRAVARSGHPHIDLAAIRAYLATLVYPLHHLDFEAVNPPVPPYDGTRPYQAIPTQASVHYQKEPGAPIDHYEFIGDGRKDPRRELADFLRDRIRARGSVIAYYKSYEGGVLKGLASHIPEAAEQLLGMEARLWDLDEPFKKAWYAHPSFLGKYSIKYVMPVLVPDLSYKTLAIQNGAEAMNAYAKLMTADLTPEERAKIKQDLKEYCGTDTLAMVKILAHLYEITSGVAA
ncbi:MAG: DUF2779 domain-containing protein [Elusimicrobia bacterium]|nr:DUF2779 domain-containing protein [Elusimicrobiota bacterium]